MNTMQKTGGNGMSQTLRSLRLTNNHMRMAKGMKMMSSAHHLDTQESNSQINSVGKHNAFLDGSKNKSGNLLERDDVGDQIYSEQSMLPTERKASLNPEIEFWSGLMANMLHKNTAK